MEPLTYEPPYHQIQHLGLESTNSTPSAACRFELESSSSAVPHAINVPAIVKVKQPLKRTVVPGSIVSVEPATTRMLLVMT